MRAMILVYAVAALAAKALPFPANAYCRGCVVETPNAKSAELLAMTARAQAPPVAIQASCHVEKQKRGTRWRRVKICE